MRHSGPDVVASQAGETSVRLLVRGLGRQEFRCAQCAVSSSAWLPAFPGTLQLANHVLTQRLLSTEYLQGGVLMQVALAPLGGKSIYLEGVLSGHANLKVLCTCTV